MNSETSIPDAPFRQGSSGKYKLLIRSVTPKYNGYEYALADADGNEYKAISPLNYALGQLLRCMVQIKVVNSSFVATDTQICSKQDFAVPIPEPKKQTKKSITVSGANGNIKIIQQPNETRLGDPRRALVSGMSYVLRVSSVEQVDDTYFHIVEDAKGMLYKVKSKQCYPVGCIVDCRIKIVTSSNGAHSFSVKSIEKHVPKPKHKTKQPSNKSKRDASKRQSGSSSNYSWPAPSKGDNFHIIYTPMGNKR